MAGSWGLEPLLSHEGGRILLVWWWLFVWVEMLKSCVERCVVVSLLCLTAGAWSCASDRLPATASGAGAGDAGAASGRDVDAGAESGDATPQPSDVMEPEDATSGDAVLDEPQAEDVAAADLTADELDVPMEEDLPVEEDAMVEDEWEGVPERCQVDYCAVGCPERCECEASCDQGQVAEGDTLVCERRSQCSYSLSNVSSLELVCASDAQCAVVSSNNIDMNVVCDADSTCDVNYQTVSSGDVLCAGGAQCGLLCEDAGRCGLECDSGSECALSCRNSGRCDLQCPDGAQCLLTLENSSLGGVLCGESLIECADGVFVCGRECP